MYQWALSPVTARGAASVPVPSIAKGDAGLLRGVPDLVWISDAVVIQSEPNWSHSCTIAILGSTRRRIPRPLRAQRLQEL